MRYRLEGAREKVSASASLYHIKELMAMGGYTLVAFLLFILSVIYLMECRFHFWTADVIAKEELENIDIHRVV